MDSITLMLLFGFEFDRKVLLGTCRNIAEGVSTMDWHGSWGPTLLVLLFYCALLLCMSPSYISVLRLQFCWERSERLCADCYHALLSGWFGLKRYYL